MDIMKYACGALVEIKLSLTVELRPFKHSHFRQLLHDRV